MKKQDLINYVAENTDLQDVKKYEAKAFVDAVLDGIVHGIMEDGEVVLSNIGTFTVVDVPERTGRNPQTGDALIIPAHKTVKCKIYKKLKDSVRN